MLKFILNLIFGRKEKFDPNGCYDEVDERTFGAEVIAGDITRRDLYDGEFNNLPNLKKIIHQAWTDFCVGCSRSYSKEGTEKRGTMSWPGAYALACKVLGYIPRHGMSILAMMKASCKYGIPEERFYPFDKNKKKSWLADWRNLSAEAMANAYIHRDKTFFIIRVPGGWSKFDAFRAYLSKFRDKNVTINTGADGHAITLCAQKEVAGELRIGGPDSYGEKGLKYRLGTTINGWRWFTKEEVAQFFNGYIGFDMDRTLAELLNEYNGKAIKVADNPVCYLVKDGKKHRIRNEYVAWAHNTLLFNPDFVYEVSEDDLKRIPSADPICFKNGENWQIVMRIMEKMSKMKPEEIKEALNNLDK